MIPSTTKRLFLTASLLLAKINISFDVPSTVYSGYVFIYRLAYSSWVDKVWFVICGMCSKFQAFLVLETLAKYVMNTFC